jgi:hypothetical protein
MQRLVAQETVTVFVVGAENNSVPIGAYNPIYKPCSVAKFILWRSCRQRLDNVRYRGVPSWARVHSIRFY